MVVKIKRSITTYVEERWRVDDNTNLDELFEGLPEDAKYIDGNEIDSVCGEILEVKED